MTRNVGAYGFAGSAGDVTFAGAGVQTPNASLAVFAAQGPADQMGRLFGGRGDDGMPSFGMPGQQQGQDPLQGLNDLMRALTGGKGDKKPQSPLEKQLKKLTKAIEKLVKQLEKQNGNEGNDGFIDLLLRGSDRSNRDEV